MKTKKPSVYKLYDFFGFGVYRKSFPDTYLFDGSEVKEYENEDSGY